MSESYLYKAWKKLKRNKLAIGGLILIIFFISAAILAPFLTPYDPIEQLIWTEGLSAKLAPPSQEHLLGTDIYGRDILTRVLYGARISLKICIAAMGLSVFVGVTLGIMAGYYGGL